MNIVLWILQVLLAAAFFAHGMLFLTPPAELVGAPEGTVRTRLHHARKKLRVLLEQEGVR